MTTELGHMLLTYGWWGVCVACCLIGNFGPHFFQGVIS